MNTERIAALNITFITEPTLITDKQVDKGIYLVPKDKRGHGGVVVKKHHEALPYFVSFSNGMKSLHNSCFKDVFDDYKGHYDFYTLQ